MDLPLAGDALESGLLVPAECVGIERDRLLKELNCCKMEIEQLKKLM